MININIWLDDWGNIESINLKSCKIREFSYIEFIFFIINDSKNETLALYQPYFKNSHNYFLILNIWNKKRNIMKKI